MVSVESKIWVEKHRPRSVSEIKGNEQIVDLLSGWVDDDSLPNILFAGPAGVGKTAATVAFARDKYGDDWQNHLLQLNASDDRGIDVVRDEVKDFARLSTVADYEFKLIFLDEADSLTRTAQPALRRIMEDYSDRTRFILSCNYPNQIIDPIQSRCSVLRMQPLSDDEIDEMLRDICIKEGVDVHDDQLEVLTEHADGDARRAIHALQSAVVDGAVSDGALDVLTAFPSEDDIQQIFDKAVGGDESCMQEIDAMLNDGVAVSMLLDTLLDVTKASDLPADAKMKMLDKIGECEYRVTQGSDPRIQLHSLMADLRVARHISLPNYEVDK